MNRQSPILLLLLFAFMFSPAIISWVWNSGSAWYRPFVVWLGIIVVAYTVQRKTVKSHDL